MVEPKLCECGCGSPAPISKINDRTRGYVKGKPKRFIHNHHSKTENNPNWGGGISKTSDGYTLVRLPIHLRANHLGYVRSHILEAEKALGKSLPDKSPVHHHHETQLVICEDQAYHMLLHIRTRALKACGHANWRKCKFCKQYDAPENLMMYDISHIYHRSCVNKYQNLKRATWKNKKKGGL